jgi:hypothetical protein
MRTVRGGRNRTAHAYWSVPLLLQEETFLFGTWQVLLTSECAIDLSEEKYFCVLICIHPLQWVIEEEPLADAFVWEIFSAEVMRMQPQTEERWCYDITYASVWVKFNVFPQILESWVRIPLMACVYVYIVTVSVLSFVGGDLAIGRSPVQGVLQDVCCKIHVLKENSEWEQARRPHSLTHGAEPFWRSCQFCSYSRTSQHFMEPGGSSPRSHEPSTGPYPEPDRSNPYHPILPI